MVIIIIIIVIVIVIIIRLEMRKLHLKQQTLLIFYSWCFYFLYFIHFLLKLPYFFSDDSAPLVKFNLDFHIAEKKNRYIVHFPTSIVQFLFGEKKTMDVKNPSMQQGPVTSE